MGLDGVSRMWFRVIYLTRWEMSCSVKYHHSITLLSAIMRVLPCEPLLPNKVLLNHDDT